jgi:hypothetical protein
MMTPWMDAVCVCVCVCACVRLYLASSIDFVARRRSSVRRWTPQSRVVTARPTSASACLEGMANLCLHSKPELDVYKRLVYKLDLRWLSCGTVHSGRFLRTLRRGILFAFPGLMCCLFQREDGTALKGFLLNVRRRYVQAALR